MGKSDNASEFFDLYRRLEGCIREHYDVPEKHGPVAWLARNPGRAFRSVAGALKYCAEVRNLLSHQESVDGDYAVEPSDSMLTSFVTLLRRLRILLRQSTMPCPCRTCFQLPRMIT